MLVYCLAAIQERVPAATNMHMRGSYEVQNTDVLLLCQKENLFV